MSGTTTAGDSRSSQCRDVKERRPQTIEHDSKDHPYPVHRALRFGKCAVALEGECAVQFQSSSVKFCIGAFLIEGAKWIAKLSVSERAVWLDLFPKKIDY